MGFSVTESESMAELLAGGAVELLCQAVAWSGVVVANEEELFAQAWSLFECGFGEPEVMEHYRQAAGRVRGLVDEENAHRMSAQLGAGEARGRPVDPVT